MTIKVELGFTDAGANPPFFTLDDATKGILDNTSWVLGGGEALVDVTSYVRSVSIQRGKSRELDRYDAGQASIEFNNNNRAFDPSYVASPYWGQIVPKRRVRVSMDSVTQFDGVIDDWGIQIDPSGFSVASCEAFGPFSKLAGLELTGYSPTQELSGARVNGALNNVGWSTSARQIGAGGATLAGGTVADGTAILDYLQSVAVSEPGDIFGDKNGNIVFRGRSDISIAQNLKFTDRGTGIPYQGISVVYGSELLYNLITTTNASSTYTASDSYSISLYGERALQYDTILANTTDLQTLANVLLGRYKNPELRFESLVVNLKAVTAQQRANLLAMELQDFITVELTPGNIPPTIVQYGNVITLNYTFTPDEETVEIGIATNEGALFILNDAVFGILDVGVLGW